MLRRTVHWRDELIAAPVGGAGETLAASVVPDRLTCRPRRMAMGPVPDSPQARTRSAATMHKQVRQAHRTRPAIRAPAKRQEPT